ncbi:MAG: beta-Ala-His dipeptidase [Porphyromonadaceae bacterium]|nr:MAG: beta-Ala-His dipeptidase [Porphyromonadaceae bacterium]
MPRPSGNLDKIREWLVSFAKENNLEYKVDEVGNVAMFRPAAPGFENAKGVVLQGHMDMVAEKLPSSNHNFLTDPIQTRIVDDWVFATDTTLGADDGLGLAIALAALTDPDIKCGALEALATVDEETGLTGATNIKADMLVGDYLLNLDSEDDGVITIGCAGGVVTPVWFDYKPEAAPADLQYFAIKIGKLMGGHSGTDINKGLASATKQLARILYMLDAKIEYRLASFNAGNLHNAIARDGVAVIGVKPADKETLATVVNTVAADIKFEYKRAEPHAEVTIESVDAPATVIDACTAKRLVAACFAAQHGVYYMSQEVGKDWWKPLPTSQALRPTPTKSISNSSVAHLLKAQKEELALQIEALFRLAGAKEVKYEGSYQGWAPNADSQLLKLAVAQWEGLYGVEPKVEAIHAGLECGLFLKVRPDMEMISYGPTLKDVHSPRECLPYPCSAKRAGTSL